jgi:hypothetical protein
MSTLLLRSIVLSQPTFKYIFPRKFEGDTLESRLKYICPDLKFYNQGGYCLLRSPDTSLRVRYLDSFCGATHLFEFSETMFRHDTEEQFVYALWATASHIPYFSKNRRLFLTCNDRQLKGSSFLKRLSPYFETKSEIYNHNSGHVCYLLTFVLPKVIEEYEEC